MVSYNWPDYLATFLNLHTLGARRLSLSSSFICQTAQSNTLFNLINQRGKNSKVRVGLTGSLPKEELELLNVKIVLGKIIYEIPADVLITDGVLS